jgi:catechol 2,3-dioxygenase-like lactoylglutathione lyase family enzyme
MRMSHVAIRVSDWVRSLRFYHDALGFRFVGEERLPADFAERLYGPGAGEVRVGWLEREGVRIQLLELPEPASLLRPGPVHLALRVADLDQALQALEKHGVRPLEDTRAECRARGARSLFVADPDGARIELTEQPGD